MLAVAAGLALALIATACGVEPASEPTSPPPPPTEEPQSPAALIESAREAMSAQEGFLGGFADSPMNIEPRITYAAPDLMLVEDFGGDFEDHILIAGGEAFVSSDGERWRSSAGRGLGFIGFFRGIYDPRAVLRYAVDPEVIGEEELQRRPQTVVSLKLNVQQYVDDLGDFEPSVRLSLNFPQPPDGGAEALEGLGYEVFGAANGASFSWQALKGDYRISIDELGRRPGGDRAKRGVYVSATIRGVESLDEEAERELRSVLAAYGADPDLISEARVQPVSQDGRQGLIQMLAAGTVRLWIDGETSLVRRLAWRDLHQQGQEWVVGFWGHGDGTQVRRPEKVIDSVRAQALGKVAEAGFDDFRKAIEAYKNRHGHYPESLTPEVLGEELARLERPWPENPFRGEPVRNAQKSPGDVHYARRGDTYDLIVYGWDHAMATKVDGPRRPAAATSPSVDAGLEAARDQGFSVPWWGRDGSLTRTDGGSTPPLILVQAEVCPEERACIWPVLLGYALELDEDGFRTPTFPTILIYARPRTGDDAPAGEPAEVAGLDPSVRVERKAVPYSEDEFAWEAMIWLPDGVVRITTGPIGRNPDRNAYNTEAGIRSLVDNLQVLNGR